MSRLTDGLRLIFGSPNSNFVINVGKLMLKMFIGSLADHLVEKAKVAVGTAEASGLSGTDKYEQAYKELKGQFAGIKEFAINLAIEICVFAMNMVKDKFKS